MQIDVIRSEERGHADYGWLKTYHMFSFADYHNPRRMGFGLLRVLNDDTVAPGQGFGRHGHRNMEIVSIPLDGALEHTDTMGTRQILRPNDIQIMSAGSGLQHSEANASATDTVSFLQIWIQPDQSNLPPRYAETTLDPIHRRNRFDRFISPDENVSPLQIHQDAHFSMAILDVGTSLEYHRNSTANGMFLFVIEGKLKAGEVELNRRDGASVTHSNRITIEAIESSEVLVIEVPLA